MTEAERAEALDAIAAEIARCTRCRLHEGRTRAVPGEGNPETEVVFVGEGPGFNEDRQGRPFVGRAGARLDDWIRSLGWQRSDVFITNVVKCRPPDNRDPLPDEIAACGPFLRRQLEVLDPAVVVTLGRYSMGTFMPGARISQAHGTTRRADPGTGAGDATVVALYHPAAALRSPAVDAQAMADVTAIPTALVESRRRREESASAPGEPAIAPVEPDPDAATQATAEDDVPVVEHPLATVETLHEPSPAAPAEAPAPVVGPSPTLDRTRPADQLTLF